MIKSNAKNKYRGYSHHRGGGCRFQESREDNENSLLDCDQLWNKGKVTNNDCVSQMLAICQHMEYITSEILVQKNNLFFVTAIY